MTGAMTDRRGSRTNRTICGQKMSNCDTIMDVHLFTLGRVGARIFGTLDETSFCHPLCPAHVYGGGGGVENFAAPPHLFLQP